MRVSVSILSEINDYENAVKKINNTSADYLHLDIMDGTFTKNISFLKDDSDKINKLSNKNLDIHIMSDNLSVILDYYISLKPEIITIHSEASNFYKYITKIKENNIKVGIAVNPKTNIDNIIKYLDIIDVVLVMSVEPGMGGQKFDESVIDKLKVLKQKKNNFMIEVDGGINDKTINYVKDYVDIVVSGSYITNSNDYEYMIESLKV